MPTGAKIDVKKALASNLETLLERGNGPRTQTELRGKSKVSQATIGRMVAVGKDGGGKNDARISSVEAVAHAYGLHAWQLLIPDLDPEHPWKAVRVEKPTAEELEQARDTLRRLPPNQRDAFIEDGLVEKLTLGPAVPDDQVGKDWARPDKKK